MCKWDFFPENTTTVLQLIVEGIIRALKQKLGMSLVLRLLQRQNSSKGKQL
jgi:hypothetical protein